jgi:undecaprenyl-diphosphatase
MGILEAVILAIIEGLTEFLPISSTGHMIIASSFMGISSEAFTKLFTVNIQFGAILSVVVLYWRRFFQSFEFYFKLLVAFIPAAFVGLFLGDMIDAMLENVLVVAIMLILGGIVLLFVDKWFAKNEIPNELPNTSEKTVTYPIALVIGLFQCIAAVFPGTSRSAATIIGGMQQGLTRKTAAEFSFFLAVPTMFAASAYKLLKHYKAVNKANLPFFQGEELQMLLLGNALAFVVAMLAIKFFVGFLTKYGFKMFGYYRIILGIIIILLLFFKVNLKML